MAKLQQLQVARTMRPLCTQGRAAAPSMLLQQKMLMDLRPRSSQQFLML